jgi:hypothetical protein
VGLVWCSSILASRFPEEVSDHGFTVSTATSEPVSCRAAALFRVATTAGVCVVAASGELDVVTCRRLAAVPERELGSRPSALIVDASAVTFCGARGMRVLLEDHRASSVPAAGTPPDADLPAHGLINATDTRLCVGSMSACPDYRTTGLQDYSRSGAGHSTSAVGRCTRITPGFRPTTGSLR